MDDEEEHRHLERLLRTHRVNLRLLEEQAARYGSLHIPLDILNSIDDEKNQIKEISERLVNPTCHEPVQGIVQPPHTPRPVIVRPPQRRVWLLWKEYLISTVQWLQAFWMGHWTIVALLAIVLVIVIVAASMWRVVPTGGSGNMTSQPVPTPQIYIEYFLVTPSREPTFPVAPNARIRVTTGEIVDVEVKVSLADPKQVQKLSFIWYTCKQGDVPIGKRVGSPKMLYTVPSGTNEDCIRVRIEEEGKLLDLETLSVDVQEQR
jgi:hypothetical protein